MLERVRPGILKGLVQALSPIGDAAAPLDDVHLRVSTAISGRLSLVVRLVQ